jgi:simple sugar transport system permease protein
MRDPASLNRPSTPTLPNEVTIGDIPNTNIHYGLVFGLIACLAAYGFVYFTKYGFAARIAGGNARAARVVGLPVERMIIGFCFAAGGAAGLAGMVEVAAVQGAASADLATGLGVPDATMLVLRGVLFVMLLSAESVQGRLTGWLPWRRARVPAAVAG